VSTEDHKAIVRHYRELHNSNDLAQLGEIVAPRLDYPQPAAGDAARPDGRQVGSSGHPDGLSRYTLSVLQQLGAMPAPHS